MTKVLCVPGDHSTGALPDWTNTRGFALEKATGPDRFLNQFNAFGESFFNTPAGDRENAVFEGTFNLNSGSDGAVRIFAGAASANEPSGSNFLGVEYNSSDGTWQVAEYDNDGSGNFNATVYDNNFGSGGMDIAGSNVDFTFRVDARDTRFAHIYVNSKFQKTVAISNTYSGLYGGMLLNWNGEMYKWSVGLDAPLPRRFYQTASQRTSGDGNISGCAWKNGDKIVVVLKTENSTQTLNAPSNANLTFSLVSSETSGSNENNMYVYEATAGSDQTGQTIAVTISSGAATWNGTVAVWPPGTQLTYKTIDRNEAAMSFAVNAHDTVWTSDIEWNGTTTNNTPATGSGTATEISDFQSAGNHSSTNNLYEDTAAGTYSFGRSDYTGTKVTQIAIVASFSSASVPGSPQSVLVAGNQGGLSVTFLAPSSDGGSAITDYLIEYAPSPFSSWSTFSDGTNTNLNVGITGLTPGTQYMVRVSAINSIGTGSSKSSDNWSTPYNTPGTHTRAPNSFPTMARRVSRVQATKGTLNSRTSTIASAFLQDLIVQAVTAYISGAYWGFRTTIV